VAKRFKVILFSLLVTAFNLSTISEVIADSIKLPAPHFDGKISVEKAIKERRSVREYTNKPLNLQEISQLLWAAQGITDPRGLRTAPSAGALYPLEIYLVAFNVHNLQKGVYKYNPKTEEIIRIKNGDFREELTKAALGQPWIKNSMALVVIVANYERTTRKYGQRGFRYVHMEAGAVAQNIHLQAVSLGIGTVVVGAFNDEDVKKIMNFPSQEDPLIIMPLGKMKK